MQGDRQVTDSDRLQVVMAQIDMLVGDIPGNAEKVLTAAQEAVEAHDADVVVFPELCLTGYPPEDLLLRPSLDTRIESALEMLADRAPDVTLIVGAPIRDQGGLFNSAVVIADGRVQTRYDKQKLPNYQVFDEKRYFAEGASPCIVEIRGVPVGLTV